MNLLKLGGSLITEKAEPNTTRVVEIRRLCSEIASALQDKPDLQLILGHGSGSFGHHAAADRQTQLGATSVEDWIGFLKVWEQARKLNTIVMEELLACGVRAISFPPSASSLCSGGKIVELSVEPIRMALEVGFVPVVYGDVSFDTLQGSAIVSTESVFEAISRELAVKRVLIAGRYAGVYRSSATEEILPEISADELSTIEFTTTDGEDVTGGMKSKIEIAMRIAESDSGIDVRIFSGEESGLVYEALLGSFPGTSVRSR